MPLQASFVADFTQWNKALADAQKGLKTFEVAGKSAQNQLQQMSKSFSGVEIKKQADLAVAAVKAIGGASALTATEQKKVNATVTEAIAKYKALGQSAPAEMIALAKATEQVVKPTEQATASVKSLALGYLAGIATWETAKRVLGGIVDFLKSSIQSYAAAERATAKLTQALRNTGNASAETIKDMSSLATQFQRTTRFSDDLVTEVEALFTQLGEVGPKDMKVAIQAAADLAEGLGIDLEQAATAVSKALQGNETSLKKLAPSLDAAAIKGGNLADIAGEIERKFGGQASAALDTYAGRVEQLANQWDNVKEAIGGAIANDEIIKSLMRGLSKELASATDETQSLTATQLLMNNAWAQGNPPLAVALGLLNQYAASANAAAEAQSFLNRTIDALAKKAPTVSLKGMFPEITAAGLAEFERQNKVIDESREAAKKAEAAYQEWAKSVTGLGQAMDAAQLEQRFNRLNASGKLSADATKAVLAEYEKLRPSLKSLPPILELIRTGYQNTLQPIQGLQRHLQSIASRAIPDANKMFLAGQAALAGFQRNGNLASHAVADLSVQMKAVPADLFTKNVRKMAGETLKFADVLENNLRHALENVSDIIVDSLIHGASFEDTAAAIGTEIGSAVGASVGFAIGGPMGAAIGEAIGSMLGPLLEKIIKTRAEKTVERIGKELGIAVTEEFAQGIEDTAEIMFGGNRQVARIFHLDGLIEQAGGLNSINFSPLIAEFRDLFSMLETGALTSAQAVEVVDKNFRKFATFVTEGGSLASKELLEIIKLADEAGLKSAEIAAFTSAEANKALGGLSKFVTARGEIFDKLGAAQKKLDELRIKAKDDSADIDPKEIEKAATEVARLRQQLEAIPLTAAGAGAVGASLFAIFEELVQGGQPAIEVLKQIDPLIESMDRQLASAGLSGGAAFQSLKDLAGLATDETFGPAFEAISGLGSALEGLHNSGLLNQETFAGLASEVTTTFEGLKSQGVDGEKAMRLIQPTLQDLWELQKDFGYEVDDSTQKMLEEAEAAGLVGEEHRTATEQMLRLTERMTLALEGIATLFGVDLVGEVDKFGKAIEDLPDDVSVDGTVDWDVPPIPAPRNAPEGGDYNYHDNYDAIPMADGGMGRVTKPTLFMAGESGPEDFAFSGANKSFSGGGSGDTTVAVIVVQNGSLQEVLAAMPKQARRNENQWAAKLAGELAKYGVR